MIAEAGGLCAWCRRAETIKIHHINLDSSHTVETNLIALCGTCHDNAHSGTPSTADLHTRKLELVYERTRAAAPLENKIIKPRKIKMMAQGNIGPVHQAENMTVNHRGAKRPIIAPAPDSISAHAAESSYIKYLREEYIRCRLLEGKYEPRRKVHPAKLQNAFKKAVGIDPMSAPINDFPSVQRKAHAAVCHTLGAAKYQNGFRPHDWVEHQRRFGSET